MRMLFSLIEETKKNKLKGMMHIDKNKENKG